MIRRVTFSIPWPFSAAHTRELLSFVFQVALITYFGLFLIESIKPGFVSFFYNLNNFLWIAVVSGVLAGLWPMVVVGAKPEPTRPSWLNIVWLGVLVLGTVLIVWKKIVTLGWLAGVIAILCGFIILGLSLLVYYDRDDDPEASQ